MKINGKVIRGKGKGKKLGFPTANVELGKNVESGVYKGKVKIIRQSNNSRMRANDKRIEANEWRAGIFVGDNPRLLEAHLIGFNGDLYGKVIQIEVGEKIREVLKFKSDEELKEQIEKDLRLISRS